VGSGGWPEGWERAHTCVRGDAMSGQDQPWESRLREAAGHVEGELKRVVAYINDEVMPDVRRNGSSALKAAAAEFERLAKKMDEANEPPKAP